MAQVPSFRLLSPETNRGSARRSLVCFPFAGGSADTFWPLLRHLPDDVAVYGVQYPREHRPQPEGRRWRDVVTALADQIGSVADPVAFFGHSLGGTVAYETARELGRRKGARPRLLVVSGAAPPDRRSTRGHLRLETEALTRLPEAWRRRARFRETYLEALRADLALFADYREAPEPVLSVPLVVFGAVDDEHVEAASLRHWGGRTTGPTRVRILDGGHFFLWDHLAEMMSVLLAAWEAAPDVAAPDVTAPAPAG